MLSSQNSKQCFHPQSELMGLEMNRPSLSVKQREKQCSDEDKWLVCLLQRRVNTPEHEQDGKVIEKAPVKVFFVFCFSRKCCKMWMSTDVNAFILLFTVNFVFAWTSCIFSHFVIRGEKPQHFFFFMFTTYIHIYICMLYIYICMSMNIYSRYMDLFKNVYSVKKLVVYIRLWENSCQSQTVV